MAFDPILGDRVRALVALRDGYSERKMFGGLCFMINGNMACGIVGDELMARLDPVAAESALAEPHVRPMDFTGKPIKGMLYIATQALESDSGLASWVEAGVDFAASLPPKQKR